MWKPISQCRLCRSSQLVLALSLNEQSFTGIFPKVGEADIPQTPVDLVKCEECHLVQLAHSYDMGFLYGVSYGYRSGLNQSMVRHLKQRVEKLCEKVELKEKDLVLDIGSNDGTLLGLYPVTGLRRIGIDPSGLKFKKYYPEGTELITDFFSEKAVRKAINSGKFKAVTSIAMFYDLEDPQSFVDEVARILDKDGIWVFEQSYLPSMLETNSYDTVCHEHLEYYSLRQIFKMLDGASLKIIDLEFNDTNGGSFAVTAAHKASPYPEVKDQIQGVLNREIALELHTLKPFQRLSQAMKDQKREIVSLLSSLKHSGKRVFGYGASTKGNVMLQYCGITKEELPYIAEVNDDKFGARTPGTNIPIISEEKARALKPDYFLVLPWHFRDSILKREKAFLSDGGKFIFAFPEIEIVSEAGIETLPFTSRPLKTAKTQSTTQTSS